MNLNNNKAYLLKVLVKYPTLYNFPYKPCRIRKRKSSDKYRIHNLHYVCLITYKHLLEEKFESLTKIKFLQNTTLEILKLTKISLQHSIVHPFKSASHKEEKI